MDPSLLPKLKSFLDFYEKNRRTWGLWYTFLGVLPEEDVLFVLTDALFIFCRSSAIEGNGCQQ
jgi:hypothetical protein